MEQLSEVTKLETTFSHEDVTAFKQEYLSNANTGSYLEFLRGKDRARLIAQGKVVEVIIPFSGFYETCHYECMNDDTMDAIAYRLFDTYADELVGDDLEKVQDLLWQQSGNYWSAYQRNYAEAYAEEWCHQAGVKYNHFGEISSPQFYNYSTDRIFAYCDYKSLQHLRVKHRKEFITWAMDNIHSYDGFVLYSEYRPENWVKRPCKTWDANMWSYFLDWYEETQFSDLAFSVYEEMYSTGVAGNCLPEDKLNLIDKCNCRSNEDE